MSNLCKRGIENIALSSHVFYDFSFILGPRGLHFRGLGHPWVAFWPLWVPRPIPAPHLVDLFEDFGSLWAPSGSPEQQKEAQRSPDGSLWSTFSTTFRRLNEISESVNISDVFSSILDEFLDGPTHVWLQPAQSKRGFSISTSASENSAKSIDFDTISETFFMKNLRFRRFRSCRVVRLVSRHGKAIPKRRP